eukprot:4454491-Amphidinium_carterae.2
MVVLELAKGGELSQLIEAHGRIDEPKAKHIFKQIAPASAFDANLDTCQTRCYFGVVSSHRFS